MGRLTDEMWTRTIAIGLRRLYLEAPPSQTGSVYWLGFKAASQHGSHTLRWPGSLPAADDSILVADANGYMDWATTLAGNYTFSASARVGKLDVTSSLHYSGATVGTSAITQGEFYVEVMAAGSTFKVLCVK